METINANIKRSLIFIRPTDELNDALNAFDATIAATFGNEVVRIKHQLWSEHMSFTSVKFTNGDYIGFRVRVNDVIDDTFEASRKHLLKAFSAFGIEMPHWMYC